MYYNEREDGLITYDYAALDKKLSECKFHVDGFDSGCNFTVASVKDFIGYQNVAKLVQVAINTGLFTRENISHFNCDMCSTIFADFSGNFGVSRYPEKSLKELTGIPSEEINRDSEFVADISLNKQDLIPTLRMK